MNLNKNFLPDKYNKGSIKKFVKVVTIVNVSIVTIIAGYGGVNVYLQKQDEKEVEALETKISSIDSSAQEEKVKLETDDIYKDYIKIKEQQESGEISILPDLEYNVFGEKIHAALNENIKLTEVSYEDVGKISISGQAIDYLDIQDFYRNIVDANLIEGAEISKVEVVPVTEGGNYAIKQVVKFEIKGATLENEQPESE